MFSDGLSRTKLSVSGDPKRFIDQQINERLTEGVYERNNCATKTYLTISAYCSVTINHKPMIFMLLCN